jgi:hypothetical protein
MKHTIEESPHEKLVNEIVNRVELFDETLTQEEVKEALTMCLTKMKEMTSHDLGKLEV